MTELDHTQYDLASPHRYAGTEFDHPTFDEQGELWDRGGPNDVRPCRCWLAGYQRSDRTTPDQFQHPSEWEKGAISAQEEYYDA